MKNKIIIAVIFIAVCSSILFRPKSELEKLETDLERSQRELDWLTSERENEHQALEYYYQTEKEKIDTHYKPRLDELEEHIEKLKTEALSALWLTGYTPSEEHNVAESDLALGDYWLSNSEWGRKPLPNIVGNTPAKRFTNFVRTYAIWFDESVFVEARNAYWVKEEVLSCIARAETSIGNENKTANNVLNYGNSDNGSTRSFAWVQENVMATAHWLSQGTYLGRYTILWELSWGGREALGLPQCNTSWEYCYATSMENWRVNVYNCLTLIHWEKKDWDRYAFKNTNLAKN